MTTDKTLPEKVYVDEFPSNHLQTTCNKEPNWVEGSTEYVRADKVADLQLVAINAALDCAHQRISETGFASWVAEINPKEVLKSLEKK